MHVPAGKIVKVEERKEGKVDRSVYAAYLSAWSVGFIVPLAVVSTALGERGLQARAACHAQCAL